MKTIRDQSLTVHGGKLFNSLPFELRNCKDSKETFKSKLDQFLEKLPDKPESQGMYPDPTCRITCGKSNSIIDWIRHLNLTDRRAHLSEEDIKGV